MKRNRFPVCAKCGSEDVVLDATAVWCQPTQQWVLLSLCDNATCEDCGECKLVWYGEELANGS